MQNDPTRVVSKPETYDTPTDRVTINRLSVDELDTWLTGIRERRLVAVQKLEATAKVKADAVRLTSFLKYERQYAIAKRALTKLDEQLVKVEGIIHKCRLLAMAAELEVSQEDEEEETIDAA
jgi:hypothetical protein